MTTKKHAFLILFLSLFLGTAIVNVSHAIQNVPEPKTGTVRDIIMLQDTARVINKNLASLTSELHSQLIKNNQAKSAMDEISNRRRPLMEAQDKLAISASSFDEVIRSLFIQKVQLTIELAGLEARREVLLGIYEESRKARVEKSAMTRSLLARLIESQREQVEFAKKLHDRGSVSNSDLRGVEAKLLEAEIRYAQLEESLAPGAGNDLGSHLSLTSLDRAEKKARLATTERLLAEHTAARLLISEIRTLDREYEKLEETWSSGVSRISDLHLKMSNITQLRETTQASLDSWHQKIRSENIQLPFDYEVPDKK